MSFHHLKQFTRSGIEWFHVRNYCLNGYQSSRNITSQPMIARENGYLSNMSLFRQFSSKNESSSKSTVDESQVDVLIRLKDVWWDTNGEVRPLHAFNELRVPFVRNGLLSTLGRQNGGDLPLRGLKLLEVGCGGGIMTEPLARLGGEIVGLDASGDLINAAKNHASLDPSLSEGLSYVHSTIEEHVKDFENAYDGVVVSEVLEHIPEKDFFIECCTKTLKPGGSIFFTTFSRTFLAWFYGIIITENVLKCIPKGTHDFKLFISPENTSRLLEKYNCETVSVRGINYNPFKNKWYWVNHKQILYGLHAIKRFETRDKE